ncbi:MAG: glycosyltransferase [Chloroflexi bacterium]|nr:glycosyltransferase [Chloroflexota bacterium]
MHLVSVIIPTYNQAKYLTAALESIFAQTYPMIEVIVVNDGCNDGTSSILKAYEPRIQVIEQENRGLPAARNRGFLASHGHYVYFLDSDDEAHPDFIQTVVNLLDHHPEYGLAYSAWKQIDSNGLPLNEIHPNREGNLLEAILTREIFFFSSMSIIQREWLQKVDLFDESLHWSDDADLWLRLASSGCQFGYIDQPLANYRIHLESMTGEVKPIQIDDWHRVLDRFFADPTLPAEIQQLRGKAYSVLNFETAGRYFRSGDIEDGREQLHQAILKQPQVDPAWFLNWLAGTALDGRTTHPIQYINLIFDHLIPEMNALKPLRTRALGQYHLASAFSAFHSNQPDKVLKHAIPAALLNPGSLSNNGFFSILVKSFFARFQKPK